MQRFRGGLVVEAQRLLYHSTLGSRVITKKRISEAKALMQADVKMIAEDAPSAEFVWQDYGQV